MNDSVKVVQVMGEAIVAATRTMPLAYIEQEEEAVEFLSAKLLTELLARGYYVMTKDEILGLVQESIKEGFFTLGKQGKTNV